MSAVRDSLFHKFAAISYLEAVFSMRNMKTSRQDVERRKQKGAETATSGDCTQFVRFSKYHYGVEIMTDEIGGHVAHEKRFW